MKLALAAALSVLCVACTRAPAPPPAVAIPIAPRASVVVDSPPLIAASPTAPLREDFGAEGLFVHREEELFVWGDAGALAFSRDGGASFVERATHVDTSLVGVAMTSDKLFVAAAEGVVLASKDGGLGFDVAWRGATNTMNGDWIDRLGSLWADAAGHTIVAGGQGFALVSNDDGATWRKRAFTPRRTLVSLFGSSANDVFGAAEDGLLVHSSGATWTRATSGTTSQLFAIWGDGDELFEGANDDLLLHSTDRGATWTKTNTGRGMIVTLWGSSAHDVFAGSAWRGQGGAILHSRDGRTWKTIDDGLRDVASIRGFGARTVYALLGDGTLLRSHGGETPFADVSALSK